MADFAAKVFQLGKRTKNKELLRDVYASVEAQTGKRIEALHPEYEGPDSALYVLELFWSVARGRGSSGFGLSPLSNADIQAWCWLNDERLTKLELELIYLLDACYLTTMMADNDGD